MAKGKGQIKLYGGRVIVHWSSWPTKYDQKGCDGFYVERVEFKRFGRLITLIAAILGK